MYTIAYVRTNVYLQTDHTEAELKTVSIAKTSTQTVRNGTVKMV